MKKYLDLSSDIPDEVVQEFEEWSAYDGHSNGHAIHWRVENQGDAAYPIINQYFLDQGLEVGERVIVHDSW